MNQNPARDEFLTNVKDIIHHRIQSLDLPVPPDNLSSIESGKMLRSKLAASLACGWNRARSSDVLEQLCAATEIVHSASLCHDDVIDGGRMRRGSPTLWRQIGRSPAILTGDVLLCESIAMVADVAPRKLHQKFLESIKEVCHSEIEQEIRLRGDELDLADCLAIARGKTGPLFAFIAFASSQNDQEQKVALEEAGYKIGTAYQLADDLIDRAGTEKNAGKTLGSDLARDKKTLADDSQNLIDTIQTLWNEACQSVSRWPDVRNRVRGYVSSVMQPAIQQQYPDFPLSSRSSDV